MIEGFRHKGLKKLFEDDDVKGINYEHLRKIKQILALLDAAEKPDDLVLPTFHLHALKGDLQGVWSITVHANWRIVFRFEGKNITDVV